MITSKTPTSHSIGESNLSQIRCSAFAPSFILLAINTYHITYQFSEVGVQLIDFVSIKLINTGFFNRCFKNTASKTQPHAPPGMRNI